MNLDIETVHVLMRPEWHKIIEDWVALCAKGHPDLGTVDLTLRHVEHSHDRNRVGAVARAGGRTFRADAQGACMGIALHDALDALDRELAALPGRPKAA
jgi:ribosome-associated translation inhibitor RaiA